MGMIIAFPNVVRPARSTLLPGLIAGQNTVRRMMQRLPAGHPDRHWMADSIAEIGHQIAAEGGKTGELILFPAQVVNGSETGTKCPPGRRSSKAAVSSHPPHHGCSDP